MGKCQSRPWIVADELWLLIESLLPEPAPKRVEGRPRVPDRQALCGILFVLHTGIQREYLPQELGFGSRMTCWRRLGAWSEAGVWDQSQAVIDSSRVRAARRGSKALPARSTRARSGSKHPLIVDGQGIPLAVSLTRGNRNDVTQLMRLLLNISAVAGGVGRPRRRLDTLLADRGYDHDKYRRPVWATGVKPVIARRGTQHGSGSGPTGGVVERTIARLHGFRRLRIRWEGRDNIHEAFLGLATCLITHRHVQRRC
ncbi:MULTISPECIES: IS5 family transposase [Streptomyces]|uniref:IS5 family transposase n=1 Tax=Streptomyces bacillaris TaxID=68179 RepID=A0ABW6E6R7_9ACTN|nr:IS5 family transposase [Streptomyces nanshensis]